MKLKLWISGGSPGLITGSARRQTTTSANAGSTHTLNFNIRAAAAAAGVSVGREGRMHAIKLKFVAFQSGWQITMLNLEITRGATVRRRQ